jgi:citrate synthase
MAEWSGKIMTHTYIHENLTELMKNFRYDAHPMGMLISSVAGKCIIAWRWLIASQALSTFYPEANPALSVNS